METTEYYNGHRPAAPDELDGRRRHYGEFYGLCGHHHDDRPKLVVWGNCQAEALRIMLDSATEIPYRTVRVPPVHELTRADMPHVDKVLDACAMLVTQPVRSGYRGLPIGTADLLGRTNPPSGHVRWPVIRYGGLYPFQVIVRHPDQPSAVPAGVPYHDLRTVLAVFDDDTDFEHSRTEVEEDRIVAAAQWSIDQLAERERRECDVQVSDTLLGLGAQASHTINHPANGVLKILATRVLAELGCGVPDEPDRELLGNIRSPLEGRVINALKLDAQPGAEWNVDGRSLDVRDVHDLQVRWYRDNPGFVGAAMNRYRELLDILGMSR